MVEILNKKFVYSVLLSIFVMIPNKVFAGQYDRAMARILANSCMLEEYNGLLQALSAVTGQEIAKQADMEPIKAYIDEQRKLWSTEQELEFIRYFLRGVTSQLIQWVFDKDSFNALLRLEGTLDALFERYEKLKEVFVSKNPLDDSFLGRVPLSGGLVCPPKAIFLSRPYPAPPSPIVALRLDFRREDGKSVFDFPVREIKVTRGYKELNREGVVTYVRHRRSNPYCQRIQLLGVGDYDGHEGEPKTVTVIDNKRGRIADDIDIRTLFTFIIIKEMDSTSKFYLAYRREETEGSVRIPNYYPLCLRIGFEILKDGFVEKHHIDIECCLSTRQRIRPSRAKKHIVTQSPENAATSSAKMVFNPDDAAHSLNVPPDETVLDVMGLINNEEEDIHQGLLQSTGATTPDIFSSEAPPTWK